MFLIVTIASVLIILWAIGTSARQNEVNTRAREVKKALELAEVDRQINEIIKKCEQDRIYRERSRKCRAYSGWSS